jgi:hypothetical protein
VFSGFAAALLSVTAVIVILLVTSRSPVLWLLPLERWGRRPDGRAGGHLPAGP